MMIPLENPFMRVSVRPDLGGRIDQITDRRTGRDWLWHPSHYDSNQTRSLTVGSSFDQHWTGGWDEVFPNDAAGHFQGRNLVDHGELWSQSWQVIEQSGRGVKMAIHCQTVPAAFEKTLVLDEKEPTLRIHYLIRNLSDETVPFLLKLHPAIAIEEGDELLMPSCQVEPVELGFSRIIGRPGLTRFPKALGADGSEVFINRMLARSSQSREFFYCSDLERGECGVKNARTGSALMMRFDRTHFPFVWSFMSFGGFDGHYVLVLEPCTTKPYDLAAAWQQGTVAVLPPSDVTELDLEVHLKERA